MSCLGHTSVLHQILVVFELVYNSVSGRILSIMRMSHIHKTANYVNGDEVDIVMNIDLFCV